MHLSKRNIEFETIMSTIIKHGINLKLSVIELFTTRKFKLKKKCL